MGAKRLTGGVGGGGAKRLKLGQVVTVTGAKRLENGCKTSWGAKRLWCEMSCDTVCEQLISKSRIFRRILLSGTVI